MDKVSMSSLSRTDSKVRAIVYGQAGTKKTTLAGTWEKPILLFDWDQKLDVLYGQKGIDVVSYPCPDVSKASQHFKTFKKDWKEGVADPKYKTIVLDSLTSYDTVNLRHFVMISGKPAESAATLPVYQDQAGWYAFFFTEMKAILDKHVIVIAHEHMNTSADSGIYSIQPLITGNKILNKLPSMFKEVWYMTKKEATDEVTLHYKPHKLAVATSLLMHGSGSIVNPTYEKIMQEAAK